jgi:MFS transporter, DHA2 family, methylenomycin A resistance protein
MGHRRSHGFSHSRVCFRGVGATRPAADAAADLVLEASFSVPSIAGLLANIAFYGLIFVLSLYFQRMNGLPAFATGLAFLPMTAVVLPANLTAPLLAERFSAPAIIAGGAIMGAVGCIGLIGIGPDTKYWTICAQLLAMGAGLGLLVPPLTSKLLGSVEKARSGIAAAFSTR